MNELLLEHENEECICQRCHWGDKTPGICHAYDPPIRISFLPTTTSHCWFIPEARWKQRPKEYQERDLAARDERSKRYWEKQKQREEKNNE